MIPLPSVLDKLFAEAIAHVGSDWVPSGFERVSPRGPYVVAMHCVNAHLAAGPMVRYWCPPRALLAGLMDAAHIDRDDIYQPCEWSEYVAPR